MKKIISLLLLVAMITLCMTACGVDNKTVLSTDNNTISNIASYEDCSLELGESSIKNIDEKEKVIKINATYTNNGDEPLYAMCSFAVRAFQNDEEIENCSDINGDESSLIKEIKSGKSVSVTYAFKLSNNSPVEVLIGEPTAEQITIGQKTYLAE